jgi:hypothetical protein
MHPTFFNLALYLLSAVLSSIVLAVRATLCKARLGVQSRHLIVHSILGSGRRHYGQVLHRSVKTTEEIRRAIQHIDKGARA